MHQKAEITDEFIRKMVASGKPYYAFLYLAGPDRNQPPDEVEKIQIEHLRHLFSLRAEGKLLINGPVMDDSDLRGIGIFNITDQEEVKKLLDADSAVKAGRLRYEIHPWFGIPGDALPK